MKKHLLKEWIFAVLMAVLVCVTILVPGIALADTDGEGSGEGAELISRENNIPEDDEENKNTEKETNPEEEVVTYVTVTVNLAEGTGTGTVSVGGAEMSDSSVEVEAGDTVISVAPDTGSYISALTISVGGEAVDVGSDYEEGYTAAVNLSRETTISVEYGTYYVVSAGEYSSDAGVVKIDGTEVSGSSVNVKPGSVISVSAEPMDGYALTSVRIGDEEQSFGTSYAGSYTVSGDVTITAVFVKTYIMTITYDSESGGTVVSDPGGSGRSGEIVVKEGDSFTVTATPDTNYRVSSVIKDEIEVEGISGNDYVYTDQETDITSDHSYTITFALNTYTVTYAEAENVTVSAAIETVEYGKTPTTVVTPEAGYSMDQITDENETEVSYSLASGTDAATGYTLTKTITADTTISVSVKEMETVTYEDTISSLTDALRTDDTQAIYVYANNDAATFTAADSYDGVRLMAADGSVIAYSTTEPATSVTATATVAGIQVLSAMEWVDVSGLPEDGIQIVVDVTEPTGTLTPVGDASESDYYHSDVDLTVAVADAGDYSGIADVSYEIWMDDVKQEDGSLYTYTDGEDLYAELDSSETDSPLQSVTVNAETYNSANVAVYLIVTDRAGNTGTSEKSLKINATPPVVSVSITGEEVSGATEGFYDAARTATIAIVDREDTFDPDAATSAVFIQALDVDGEAATISTVDMISEWETDEADSSLHTATVAFRDDAHYRWSIHYVNKADLSCSCGYEEENLHVADESTEDETAYAFTIDTQESAVTLTPSAAAADNGDDSVYGYYNDDVEVSVSASDSISGYSAYSGIRRISYEITCDGETTTGATDLYSNDKTLYGSDASEIDDLTGSDTESLTVTASENNSCNVIVSVTVEDNAGHITTESVALDIDMTNPTITVSYDNNMARNASYFDTGRTATVVITERTSHFDAAAAAAEISIKAADSSGSAVAGAYTISEWITEEGEMPDDAIHRTTITYSADANYTFVISYTDKAANTNQSVDTGSSQAPYKFTVDTNAPTGTLTAVSSEGRTATWNNLLSALTFGYYSNKNITISSMQADATSPIESVKYYKISSSAILTRSALEKLDTWTDFNGLTATANQQFVVYLQITDMAGNVSYLCTDGLIVDDTAPVEETIAPEITVTPQQPVNDIYNDDVKVSIRVTDPTSGGTYSGLKEVRYEVLNMGTVTQSGTLYSFTEESPSITDLRQTWTGSITVDAVLNNSNDVQIIVYAVDNAYNTSQDSVAIQIDVTAPVIHISYSNNSADSSSYYSESRTATIAVTERNFNADDVTVTITNTNSTIPSLSGWTTVTGFGNGDSTAHTATVTYSADGDYTFDIECADLAGNACTSVTYASGTTNPTEFTIDQTDPTIMVTYDNNSAADGKYFSAARTATVTVNEHNFDVDRVVFTQTAFLDGSSITVPTASWSNNGDVHTATIAYSTDGDYTFEVEMTDMAGNESGEANYGSSVAANDFTVDLTIEKPLITGVENGASYKDDVIPGIDFSDINFSSYEITLIRTRKDELNVDVTEQFITSVATDSYGGTGEFDTFEKIQDNDGIYTLTVTIQDLAGNEESESVTFTVNRFGSVYAFNQALVDLQDSYVQSIDDELVITEYNPDRLVEGSLQIEVTKDGTPVADTVYEVSPVINEYAEVGTSGWYQYEYTIDTSNFTEDGIYRIAVSSEDEAGNLPETSNYDECEVLFRVDTTAAEIIALSGLEESIVNAESVDVDFEIFDAIGLESVTVYLDGDEYLTCTGEGVEAETTYSSAFTINAAAYAQSVRIVVVDLAGNVLDTDEQDTDGNYVFSPGFGFNRNITISTNFFVRWFANKPLFWGSITAAAAALIVLLTLYKKKKGGGTEKAAES